MYQALLVWDTCCHLIIQQFSVVGFTILHFTNEEAKTQRDCNLPKVNQSANVLEPGFEPRGI